jgi:hypothetical protein
VEDEIVESGVESGLPTEQEQDDDDDEENDDEDTDDYESEYGANNSSDYETSDIDPAFKAPPPLPLPPVRPPPACSRAP